MKKVVFSLLLLFCITLSFQACNRPIAFDPASSEDLKSNSNGDAYLGKPTPYDFLDAVLPCSEKGANGVALPNDEIFLFSDGRALKVRENCADIPPVALKDGDITFTANGSLVYQNKFYASNANQGPFDVLAATCPAGRTMLANPVRSTMLADPLNLFDSAWDLRQQTVVFAGSAGSLPFYKVQRQDPSALEKWHLISQNPNLVSGETYVYSFFVKRDPAQQVYFMTYHPSGLDLQVEFDLATGNPIFQMNQGSNLVGTRTTSFAGGYYINIYFQPLISTNPNVGVGAAGEYLGSEISVTSLQLEKVSNFCSP